MSRLTSQLRAYEVDNLNRYDLLVAISEADLKKFKQLGYKNGAISSPVGLNLKDYQASAQENSENHTLSFIGSLDWQPNLEGLSWYLDKVHSLVDGGVLHIAGRNTPKEIRDLKNERLIVHGEVDSALDFIDSHNVMIVPLLSGSGMRVKILEGMAMGKCVVTTSKGLEGIEAEHQVQVLVADSPEDFAKHVNWALQNPNEAKELGTRAKDFIKARYDARLIAKQLIEAYEYVCSDDYAPVNK